MPTGNAIQGATGPGSPPVGTAGGDLGGTYPSPTVTATHLAAALPIAQGGTGQATDPLQPWMASDYGWLGMSVDPAVANSTNITTAGTLYLVRFNIRLAVTFTNVIVDVQTAGVGASTQSFVGVWSSAGTLLSGSSDVGASLTSTGTKTLALTTPQALSAGTFVWAGILTNLATTQPTLAKSSASNTEMNKSLAASGFRTCVNGTGLTSLASITPGSNVLAGSFPLWMAFS